MSALWLHMDACDHGDVCLAQGVHMRGGRLSSAHRESGRPMRLAAILFGITLVLVIVVTILVGCAWALARWAVED